MGAGLSVQDVKNNTKANLYDVILDVRTKEEYDLGHYPSAINIPLNSVEDKFKKLFPNKNISVLIYCRSGSRATQAKNILQSQGYIQVKTIDFPYTYLLD